MIPMLFGKIKSGYVKDHRFYKALQYVLLNEDSQYHGIRLYGAPSHICEREGVRLRSSKNNPECLWVYFRINPKPLYPIVP